MSKPRVLNRRNNPIEEGVLVCRPTRFGNPFKIGVDGDRAEVIQKYREWLLSQPELVSAVKSQLRGRHLICWCAPLPCHADVLLEIANN